MFVVASLAQCLMVLWVPEQLVVALVWFDVVNNACRDNLTEYAVHHAQRMLSQVTRPILLPPAAVTTLTRCFSTVCHETPNKKPAEIDLGGLFAVTEITKLAGLGQK